MTSQRVSRAERAATRRSFVLLLLLVIVGLLGFCCHSAIANTESELVGADFYGKLQVPPNFFRSDMARDTFYHTQPGQVILTDGSITLRATVRSDGSFVVKQVPFGFYLLQADFFDFVFPTVRVEVQHKRTEYGIRPVIHCYRNEYPVTPLRGSGMEEESPAVIPTAGAVQYYVPREKFDPMALLKSPMVLIMLFAGAMLLMAKMIPEEELKKSRDQSKEMRRMMRNPQEALENALSGGTKEIETGKKKKKQ